MTKYYSLGGERFFRQKGNTCTEILCRDKYNIFPDEPISGDGDPCTEAQYLGAMKRACECLCGQVLRGERIVYLCLPHEITPVFLRLHKQTIEITKYTFPGEEAKWHIAHPVLDPDLLVGLYMSHRVIPSSLEEFEGAYSHARKKA